MARSMLRSLVVVGMLLMLSGGNLSAQTGDGQTPAAETVCDELLGATPGLYGLCVAFCEAHDCEPDFSAADPFAGCHWSAVRLLKLYDRKKRHGDPDMPCIRLSEPEPDPVVCPCWEPGWLAEIDGTTMFSDCVNTGTLQTIFDVEGFGSFQIATVDTALATCEYSDFVNNNFRTLTAVSPEELGACQIQLIVHATGKFPACFPE